MGKSFTAVAVFYGVVVALAAIGFDIAESKYGIVDSLWWAFTTATTTGYGDMYPVTTTGRAIAIFLMHFGSGFAFPIMTALMSAKLIVDSDAFTHDEQEEMKERLRNIELMLMEERRRK